VVTKAFSTLEVGNYPRILLLPFQKGQPGFHSDIQGFIQELENAPTRAPTSIAMFLVEYVIRGGAQFLS
jgi:hypothetical protein